MQVDACQRDGKGAAAPHERHIIGTIRLPIDDRRNEAVHVDQASFDIFQLAGRGIFGGRWLAVEFGKRTFGQRGLGDDAKGEREHETVAHPAILDHSEGGR